MREAGNEKKKGAEKSNKYNYQVNLFGRTKR